MCRCHNYYIISSYWPQDRTSYVYRSKCAFTIITQAINFFGVAFLIWKFCTRKKLTTAKIILMCKAHISPSGFSPFSETARYLIHFSRVRNSNQSFFLTFQSLNSQHREEAGLWSAWIRIRHVNLSYSIPFHLNLMKIFSTSARLNLHFPLSQHLHMAHSQDCFVCPKNYNENT